MGGGWRGERGIESAECRMEDGWSQDAWLVLMQWHLQLEKQTFASASCRQPSASSYLA